MQVNSDGGQATSPVLNGTASQMQHWQGIAASKKKSDERILGSGSFVERMLREAEERRERRLQQQACGIDLPVVMRCVGAATGLRAEARKGQ